MKVDILTREYPPHVYGGAGVHAEELSKVLAERIDVTVRAFDGKRTEADIPAIPNAANAKGSLKVVGYDTPSELADANPALKTFGVDLQIANDVDADIIHAHTVRLPGRLPGQDAAWHSAGYHRALFGAVPPMEA